MQKKKKQNYGEILAKFELKAKTHDLQTRPSSLILSGNRAYINVVNEAKTNGMIGSKIWSELKVGRLTNGLHARLGGNGFVRIAVDDLLDNLGDIAGGRFLSVSAKNMLNSKPWSQVNASTDLNVDVKQDAINHGSFYAGHNADYTIARKLDNKLSIEAKNDMDIMAGEIDKLEITSLLKAQNISLTSKNLSNGGEIAGILIAKISSLLKNLATGKIHSPATMDITTEKLINSGMIEAAQKMALDVKTTFDNLASGVVTSKDTLGLICASILGNAGKIKTSLGGLTLQSEVLFENVVTGTISVADAIAINAGKMVNSGAIDAAKKISLDIKTIFENQRTGRITSQGQITTDKDEKSQFNNPAVALGLVCASLIRNSGTIEGWSGVKLTAEKILQDLTTSRLVSNENIELIAKFAIENAGVLSGKNLDLITQEVAGYNKEKKQESLTIDTALPETGNLIVGNQFIAEIDSWDQTGGMVKSGIEGSHITVKNGVEIKVLRVTELLQSGQGYTVAPSFEAAHMISEGNQEVVVTAGGFIATGIYSLAGGDNSIQSRDAILIKPPIEEYDLPTERTGKNLNKKTMGGTSTSSLHNEFMARGDVKMD